VAWSDADGGFYWQAKDMGCDGNWRLFSSDSGDGDEGVVLFLENDLKNVADDPLFLSCQDLFNWNQPEADGPGEHMQDLPWAFDDHPAIRNAYIHIFLGVSFDGMTHKTASLMLNGFANTFSLAAYAGLDIPGVERFVRTIGTVEKRFGISAEGFIIYLVICPICWHSHLLSQMEPRKEPHP
jgi:hypothetical protein